MLTANVTAGVKNVLHFYLDNSDNGIQLKELQKFRSLSSLNILRKMHIVHCQICSKSLSNNRKSKAFHCFFCIQNFDCHLMLKPDSKIPTLENKESTWPGSVRVWLLNYKIFQTLGVITLDSAGKGLESTILFWGQVSLEKGGPFPKGAQQWPTCSASPLQICSACGGGVLGWAIKTTGTGLGLEMVFIHILCCLTGKNTCDESFPHSLPGYSSGRRKAVSSSLQLSSPTWLFF